VPEITFGVNCCVTLLKKGTCWTGVHDTHRHQHLVMALQVNVGFYGDQYMF